MNPVIQENNPNTEYIIYPSKVSSTMYPMNSTNQPPGVTFINSDFNQYLQTPDAETSPRFHQKSPQFFSAPQIKAASVSSTPSTRSTFNNISPITPSLHKFNNGDTTPYSYTPNSFPRIIQYSPTPEKRTFVAEPSNSQNPTGLGLSLDVEGSLDAKFYEENSSKDIPEDSSLINTRECTNFDPQKPSLHPYLCSVSSNPLERYISYDQSQQSKNARDYDSPTTIDMPSPQSSCSKTQSEDPRTGMDEITADDILGTDPFQEINSVEFTDLSDENGTANQSLNNVSTVEFSFNDYSPDVGGLSSDNSDFKDILSELDSMLFTEAPKEQLGTISETTTDAPETNASVAPKVVKKKTSMSKINKKPQKALKKASSFSGQPNFVIPVFNPSKSKMVMSMNECSQRFSAFELANKYSFVYESGSSNNDETQPKSSSTSPLPLRKSKSSITLKHLQERTHTKSEFYNHASYSRSTPHVLKNMNAGMVEFQVNVGNTRRK